MKHERFKFQSLDDVKQKINELGVNIPISEDLSPLSTPVKAAGITIPNRFAIQPMEGCDSDEGGKPSELTLRRYKRFAESGAGLIWAEAAAITEEGRANPRQLMITDKNLDDYKRMVEMIKTRSMEVNGYEPKIFLQLTHSGRYSKPQGTPAPLIGYNNPILEGDTPIASERILSDDYLRNLIEKYGVSASLAEKAGFDGVDIKACHRYLVCELLSAFNRPGDFGGSFENRTRLLREGIASARSAVSSDIIVTTRMNLYDGYPYPLGWGVSPNGGVEPDMSEPIELVRRFYNEYGMRIIDFTLGNPYNNPHVNRPYDVGAYEAPEHPLEGVARACDVISQIKRAVPEMVVVSSEYSYLRQFSPYQAAGMISGGHADLAGYGRMAFAYPEFARDILTKGELDAKKCCITCSKCTELMRAGSVTGCIIKDQEVYLPLYQKFVQHKDN